MNYISGLVIEETGNTVKVLTPLGSIRVIPKDACWFYIEEGPCTYLINGIELMR